MNRLIFDCPPGHIQMRVPQISSGNHTIDIRIAGLFCSNEIIMNGDTKREGMAM